MAYAKSDFVAGDEVTFDDPMDNEQLGEFPSMWDLIAGNSEVLSINGKKALFLKERYTKITLLMKTPKNYLGDVFTVEYDYLVPSDKEESSAWITMEFLSPDGEQSFRIERSISGDEQNRDDRTHWYWNESSKGEKEIFLSMNKWHHFVISFNKRAMKFYIDGVRYANIPNVTTLPGWFSLGLENGDGVLILPISALPKVPFLFTTV